MEADAARPSLLASGHGSLRSAPPTSHGQRCQGQQPKCAGRGDRPGRGTANQLRGIGRIERKAAEIVEVDVDVDIRIGRNSAGIKGQEGDR